MARIFLGPNIHLQKLGFFTGPITFLIVLAAVISVFSALTFLCGSHDRGIVKSTRRKEAKKAARLGGEKKTVIEKMKSGLTAKIVSGRKVQDAREATDDDLGFGVEDRDGDVVWKKAIIKGEKCKPIDFSGKILYDTDGNLLTD